MHNIHNTDKNKSYKINNHNFNDSLLKSAVYHKPFNELHNQKE